MQHRTQEANENFAWGDNDDDMVATHRNQVFGPTMLNRIENKETKEVTWKTKGTAWFELENALCRAGVFPAPVRTFVNILWFAGENLNMIVGSAGMAQTMGMNKSNVVRSVDKLIEIGIIRRSRREDRNHRYKFLKYKHMMQIARAWAVRTGVATTKVASDFDDERLEGCP